MATVQAVRGLTTNVDESAARLVQASGIGSKNISAAASQAIIRGSKLTDKVVDFAFNLTGGALAMTNGLFNTSVAITMGCALVLHDTIESFKTELEQCEMKHRVLGTVNYECLYLVLDKKNKLIKNTKQIEKSSILSTGNSIGNLIDISLKELGCFVPYLFLKFRGTNCKLNKVKLELQDELQTISNTKKLLLEELKNRLNILYSREIGEIESFTGGIKTSERSDDEFLAKKEAISKYSDAHKTPYAGHPSIVEIVGDNGSLMGLSDELKSIIKKLKEEKDAKKAKNAKNANNAKKAAEELEIEKKEELKKLQVEQNELIIQTTGEMLSNPKGLDEKMTEMNNDIKLDDERKKQRLEDSKLEFDKRKLELGSVGNNSNKMMNTGIRMLPSNLQKNIQKRFTPEIFTPEMMKKGMSMLPSNLKKNIQNKITPEIFTPEMMKKGMSMLPSNLKKNIQNKITPNTLKQLQ
jgi:hypothetical protein